MMRQSRSKNRGNRTISRALVSLDRTADLLLRSNTECLIPEDDTIKHNQMNNCHVIAEGRLGLIANNRGEVLCWPTSMRSIGREAQRAIAHGQFDTNPLLINIDRYEPVKRSKTHKDCKFTLACKNHDDKVFKAIDSVARFDPMDGDTLFKLGLRTVAAYTAWYRGYKKWSQKEFRQNREIREILRDYPSLQPAWDAVSGFGEQEITAATKLEEEMARWQAAYQQAAWHRATSEIRKIAPTIQVAAAGIPGTLNIPVFMTIHPEPNGGCLLLVTVLEDETRFSFLRNMRRRAALRNIASEWARNFKELKPVEWLPKLARICEFLYVSPDDYYDDQMIPPDDRSEIERAMTQKTPSYKM